MKRTPFYEIHRALGAKVIEFAGFEMPVQYPSGIVQEHMAVRELVGVFDVSHMGEFEVRGSDAESFLQRMTVNDVTKLSPGKVQYSAMCYDDGGIVDDFLVYHCGDFYLLVVNASNRQKDLEWLLKHKDGDVAISDVSDDTALLAVQGPKSLETLQKLTSVDLAAIQYYRFVRGKLVDREMIISRTGYTGEIGFELYFNADPKTAEHVWRSIFEAGKEFGIAPVGLGARDTLRLEMGFCLYGNDIDETTNPLEAGLGWITKTAKGDFVGKEAIVRAQEAGLQRRLIGFTLPDRNLARHGYDIKLNGVKIGRVTSGTFSPVLRQGIGMGYVLQTAAVPGKVLGVDVRAREVPATVVSLPFIHRS